MRIHMAINSLFSIFYKCHLTIEQKLVVGSLLDYIQYHCKVKEMSYVLFDLIHQKI